MTKSLLNLKEIKFCLDEMEKMFPNATIELNFENNFELVVAVLLSAQSTDEQVNRVTEHLFAKYKTPEDYLAVSLEELQRDIQSLGLYRNKAKSIQRLSRTLIDEFNGVVPNTREELMRLGGVGRKTANVVLSVAFDVPALAVDTHVERVAKRLGIARWKDSVLEVERTLMRKIPEEDWNATHHRLIFFGRYHCKARNPNCLECPLLELCREGQKRMRKLEREKNK